MAHPSPLVVTHPNPLSTWPSIKYVLISTVITARLIHRLNHSPPQSYPSLILHTACVYLYIYHTFDNRLHSNTVLGMCWPLHTVHYCISLTTCIFLSYSPTYHVLYMCIYIFATVYDGWRLLHNSVLGSVKTIHPATL